MPFVSRNENGAITGVFAETTPAAREELDADDPELRRYLESGGESDARETLAESATRLVGSVQRIGSTS